MGHGFVENTLGARIAKLREARGLTGEQLGRALGLQKSQISKIESGTRRLDVSEVALMADALGVSLGELLGTSQSRSLAIASRVIAPAHGRGRRGWPAASSQAS